MTKLGQLEYHIPLDSEMNLQMGMWHKPGSCEHSFWISDETSGVLAHTSLQEPVLISRNFANQLLDTAIIKN